MHACQACVSYSLIMWVLSCITLAVVVLHIKVIVKCITLHYDEYGIMEIKEMFDDLSDWTYVEPILEKLERYEDILNWDKDTGEILFQNKLILGSNIVELLKNSLSRGLHPKGKTDFYLGLGMINLKAKYIKDAQNKYLLQINSRNRYYNDDNDFGYKQIKKHKWVD